MLVYESLFDWDESCCNQTKKRVNSGINSKCNSSKLWSFSINTESYLSVIVFPNDGIFTEDVSDNTSLINEIESIVPIQKHGKFNCKEIIDVLLNIHIHEFELGIIQCKTNWNDNAQIPML